MDQIQPFKIYFCLSQPLAIICYPSSYSDIASTKNVPAYSVHDLRVRGITEGEAGAGVI
jgi:hypothetical protein